MHNNENIQEEWKNIKSAILEASNQIIGTKQYKCNKSWFDQKCIEAINKVKARRKMLHRGTREAKREYSEKRRIAKKVCKDRKREAINKKLQYINQQYFRHATKEIYKGIEYKRTSFQCRLHNVKNKSDEILSMNR